MDTSDSELMPVKSVAMVVPIRAHNGTSAVHPRVRSGCTCKGALIVCHGTHSRLKERPYMDIWMEGLGTVMLISRLVITVTCSG